MTGFPSAVSNFQIIRCCGLLYSNGRHWAMEFSLFKFRLIDRLTKIISLLADVSIFTVPGIALVAEERKFPPAVLRAAQELKNKAKF